MYLKYKSTFLSKLTVLELNGESQILLRRLYDFINENIDYLYNNQLN